MPGGAIGTSSMMQGTPFFQDSMQASVPHAHSHAQSAFQNQPSTLSGFDVFESSAPGFTPVNTTMPPPQISADSMSRYHGYRTLSESPGATLSESYSPQPGSPTAYSPYITVPLTPKSVGSEGIVLQTTSTPQDSALSPSDPRRVSVQSLVNDFQSQGQYASSNQSESRRQYPIADSASTTYGYDLGLPDLDTPRNDDCSAIATFSPQSHTMEFDDETPHGTMDPGRKVVAFEKGGYYAKPVPIRIPKSLEPLPPLLMENQMNLLYFHHFLNHTARILVPHDCERNPFRHVLPKSEYLQAP